MCSPATCRSCGKASYTGCGRHVEQVLREVPKEQRCSCAPTMTSTGAASTGTASTGGGSFLARLFGR